MVVKQSTYTAQESVVRQRVGINVLGEGRPRVTKCFGNFNSQNAKTGRLTKKFYGGWEEDMPNLAHEISITKNIADNNSGSQLSNTQSDRQ